MDDYICPRCGKKYPIRENHWECECGSTLELEPTRPYDPNLVDPSLPGLWRYASTLPVDSLDCIVTMGEGQTPLIPFKPGKDDILCKLEFTNPTGSYKDRGMTVLVSKLKEIGVREVVEDSSGNAGAAMAAYAGRAGIHARIFVPASHSSGKMRQIQAYGAELVPVEGSRQDTEDAAIAASRRSYYGSHARSPLFVEGCKTIAYEIWEQMGGRTPGMIVTPLGQGSLVLGIYKGFKELVEAGYAAVMPRLIGVQAEACQPLALAFERGLDRSVEVEVGHTLAEGIKIGRPVRDRLLLAAIRDCHGAFISVNEDAIARAQQDLAHRGIYAEPTSAVTLAGYRKLQAAGQAVDPAVLILTGAGLKTI